LIKEIVAVGKPTCAFVNSGPPLSIGNLVNAVPAVMQCWYLGQESGYAMIDALFGDINPSGKLPISFPRTTGHIPAYYNYKAICTKRI
jgi:Glycosyl hydrolase family 3 C terminal domain.